MSYLLGTDEAGYGPNLGPLVITASVWELPTGTPGDDLYALLDGAVVPEPLPSNKKNPSTEKIDPLVLGDSKKLYQSGGSWKLLENGLWTLWSLLEKSPGTWKEVWNALVEDEYPLPDDPWHRAFDFSLPRDADRSYIAHVKENFCSALEKSRIRFIELKSRAVFPGEFNRLLDFYGNKASLLSQETLLLVRRRVDELPAAPVKVFCDKHGGRNQYMPLLNECFPDAFVEIRAEGRQESVYHFRYGDRPIQMHFRMKGERILPAAVASMASKYLRELAMEAFNIYWQGKVPGLKPTAGYPVDAKRFWSEIQDAIATLGMPEKELWRRK